MCATYKQFTTSQIPENICKLIQPELQKLGMFNQGMRQTGRYIGFKVGYRNQDQYNKFKYILKKAFEYTEAHKNLKSDKVPV